MLTDTYAHLGGSLIGKHKLAPKISSNKTLDNNDTRNSNNTKYANIESILSL